MCEERLHHFDVRELAFSRRRGMTLEDFPLKIKASATGLVFPDYNLAQAAPVTSYDLPFVSSNIDGLDINNDRLKLFS